MITIPAGVRVLLATRPVDFRKGAHGLAALAAGVLAEDPFSGVVIVWRARRADRMKLLVWDSSGLVLVWKQLQQGAFRCASDVGSGVQRVTAVAECGCDVDAVRGLGEDEGGRGVLGSRRREHEHEGAGVGVVVLVERPGGGEAAQDGAGHPDVVELKTVGLRRVARVDPGAGVSGGEAVSAHPVPPVSCCPNAWAVMLMEARYAAMVNEW